MLAAWGVEAAFGWPDWLYKRIRHPVVWLGAAIAAADRAFNRSQWSNGGRYLAGMATTLAAVALAAGLAVLIAQATPPTWPGFALEALAASSLLASRSLYDHVAAVARPLAKADMEDARRAVSLIVGRDPNRLDAGGMARAGLESLAENASDGVIAPLFWGALFGLPGIAAYKAINTLDSMVGHKTERHAAFGGFAARLDDIANLVPARITGLLFAAASLRPRAFAVMARDARRHRSPNAGWPEAAMAGALGVRLSGPRAYGDRVSEEPWLNPAAPDPMAEDMAAGLGLYVRAMALAAGMLGVAALGLAL
ncbi:MAG: adenosylcobinamide-phosphate synthase CbiB [Pseudomonadota bacterium]